jgi:hypothetical protein
LAWPKSFWCRLCGDREKISVEKAGQSFWQFPAKLSGECMTGPGGKIIGTGHDKRRG